MTPASEAPSDAVEKLARIIDPWCWEDHRSGITFAELMSARSIALNQADHILAAGYALRSTVIEECHRTVLEQRCERGTPWDLACTTIASAILALAGGGDEGRRGK